MRATNRGARTVKGWASRAPKTKGEREALYARCGAAAFLDPANRAYPVMAKSGPCVVDCKGLRAAKSRAGQQHKRKLRAKADRLDSRASCSR